MSQPRGIVSRVPGYPFLVQTSARLPDDLSAPAHARALIRRNLADWDLPESIDDAEIVGSELVANALRHGAAPIVLTLGTTPDHLVVAVQDAAAGAVPTPRLADSSATNGRGMHLISALSRRWGCTSDGTTKIVWAELPLR